jgi:hypothetical protein
MFARSEPAKLTDGLDRLRQDLETGEWDRRYGQLRDLETLDIGYCLVVAPI